MDDTPEIWVDIRNYEGRYQISNKGRVKSLEREVSHDGITWTQPERILCPWCGTTSLYDRVRLYKGGVGTKFSVHRLVAEHFLPDWDPVLEINHIDGNRCNNAADNLEMCTHQRNMAEKRLRREKPQCQADQRTGGRDTGDVSCRRDFAGDTRPKVRRLPTDGKRHYTI